MFEKKNILERTRYFDQIQPFINKQLIKVLTGQRRVGKSYLLFQIINWIKKQDKKANIIYINKEDLAFDFLKTYLDLNDFVLSKAKNNQMNYVFIDEIQDIEHFEKALRSFQLKDNFDIYCTGSNANMLSGELATFLSGRYIEINIFSLSFLEFIKFHQLENSEKSLEKYLHFGGLPYLIHLPLDEKIVFEYIKSVYTTIAYRDIIERHQIRDVRFLEQLILFLANNTGSLFTSKSISDFLKSQKINKAPNQVQTYLQYLTDAFIIQRVERYDIVGKRIFETGEKYFFENLGIRNALWGYRKEDEGKILENVVYNHLRYKGFDVKVGYIDALEIDFIAEKSGEKKYFQVALSVENEKTREREFGNLIKIKDNYPKTLITKNGFQGNTFQGIPNISLYEFLNEF